MEVAGLTAFIIFLFIGIYATVFGLPGTALILLDVLIYALATGFSTIGFKVIILLVLMSIAAETIGTMLEIRGMRSVFSIKGIIASICGALAGAVLLTPFLMGLGFILGIFLGGFFGYFAAEIIRQNKLKHAFKASIGAIIFSATGILTKGFFAVAMAVIALINIYS